MSVRPVLSLVLVAASPVTGHGLGAGQRQAPMRGGILDAMLAEDPPGFSIHETATISVR